MCYRSLCDLELSPISFSFFFFNRGPDDGAADFLFFEVMRQNSITARSHCRRVECIQIIFWVLAIIYPRFVFASVKHPPYLNVTFQSKNISMNYHISCIRGISECVNIGFEDDCIISESSPSPFLHLELCQACSIQPIV